MWWSARWDDEDWMWKNGYLYEKLKWKFKNSEKKAKRIVFNKKKEIKMIDEIKNN